MIPVFTTGLEEPLRDFIKRKGGINKCASRFARFLGRSSPYRAAASALWEGSDGSELRQAARTAGPTNAIYRGRAL
jgi:hypothetical protein